MKKEIPPHPEEATTSGLTRQTRAVISTTTDELTDTTVKQIVRDYRLTNIVEDNGFSYVLK